MSCPEGAPFPNDVLVKEEDSKTCEKINKGHEGSASLELNSFKNPKTWKRSITNFFRNQLRSSKSNDGDPISPSGSHDSFEEKKISTEQKWQSLGKVFRRQSFAEHWPKSANQQGESTSQTKRLAVRKVLSSYFGKAKTSTPVESNEN